MQTNYVIKVQEYYHKDGGIVKYGYPYCLRDEHNRVMFFKDEQYAQFLATELNNSPLRDYYVEPARTR